MPCALISRVLLWFIRGVPVAPPPRLLQIKSATGISRHVLHPDLYSLVQKGAA